jgi:glutamate racemase
MIEEGWLQNAISQQVIDAYLSDTGFENIDTLILGCTHYPLIKKEIQDYFDKNNRKDMLIVDSSFAVANHVKMALEAKNLLLEHKTDIPHQFFLSDFTQNFEDSARLFLGENVYFEKVKLEE